jgi:hypothetical protein
MANRSLPLSMPRAYSRTDFTALPCDEAKVAAFRK